MGFTYYEKNEFQNSMRDQESIRKLVESCLPDDVLGFLKYNNLLNLVRDYCIIPKSNKLHKPESLTVTYFLDQETTVYDILLHWTEFLTPPVKFIFFK